MARLGDKHGCPHNPKKKCEPCRRAQRVISATNWRKRNPEKYRASQKRNNLRTRSQQLTADRKRRGIVFPDGVSVESLLALQENACAICCRPFDRTPFVDHDHAVNGEPNVRGMLCTRCNTGIGHLGDDISRLLDAVEYLRNPPIRRAVST